MMLTKECKKRKLCNIHMDGYCNGLNFNCEYPSEHNKEAYNENNIER